MTSAEGAGLRRRKRLWTGVGLAMLVVACAAALATCSEESAEEPGTAPGKGHTVTLEVDSDYGRPVEINYFGYGAGMRGMNVIDDRGGLSALSSWKTTFTVPADNPWIQLTANGTGCIGRPIDGDACEIGAIPNEQDVEGTGTTTCRIAIDGEIVAEESHTYPTIIPVTCISRP